MKAIGLLISVLLFFSACDESMPDEGDSLHFIAAGTTNQYVPRVSATSFVIDKKAYLITGRKGPDVVVGDCWRFDPNDNSWEEFTPFPGTPRVNAVSFTVGDLAYAGLGFAPDSGMYNLASQLRDWWCFSASDASWTRMADFPSPASNGCAGVVAGGKIYLGFGFDGWSFTNEWWCYDPSTNAWKQLTTPAPVKRSGAVACSDGSRVFLGSGYNSRNMNDWWEYLPETDSWIQRCAFPDKGRNFGRSIQVDGRFFVATGHYFRGVNDGGHLKNDLLEYDAEKDKWIRRGQLPNGGRQNATSFVIDTKAYIGFGENEETVLGDLWSFEP